jgi:AcrR family transcriptional regulator
MRAADRIDVIVAGSVAFFAMTGFAGSTHVLAEAIGVRQGLIYKYFSDKDTLIEATLAQAETEIGEAARAGLAVAKRPGQLSTRAFALIDAFKRPDDEPMLRLFMHALLSGRLGPADRT